ncbi:MAG TPA: DoxX family protein [Azospirillaceae bacterium]|nr:DoxX family protein [Azospirillaceae bacterium]
MNGFRDPDKAALLLRLSLGTMYLAHAGLKLFTFGMAGTSAFFEAQGLPGWSAYAVVAAEAVGGVLLLLGIRAGLTAAALLPVLAGAAWVHLPNGWVFTAPGGGWEYPAFLAAASLVMLLLDWDGRRSVNP